VKKRVETNKKEKDTRLIWQSAIPFLFNHPEVCHEDFERMFASTFEKDILAFYSC